MSGGWGSGGLNWLSLDHHGDGNVVVVRGVLGLVSLLSSDGLESVVSDNLSEGLEGHTLDLIQAIGWGNLNGHGELLINWDGNQLGVSLKSGGIVHHSNTGVGVRVGSLESGKGVVQKSLGSVSGSTHLESSGDELHVFAEADLLGLSVLSGRDSGHGGKSCFNEFHF